MVVLVLSQSLQMWISSTTLWDPWRQICKTLCHDFSDYMIVTPDFIRPQFLGIADKRIRSEANWRSLPLVMTAVCELFKGVIPELANGSRVPERCLAGEVTGRVGNGSQSHAMCCSLWEQKHLCRHLQELYEPSLIMYLFVWTGHNNVVPIGMD